MNLKYGRRYFFEFARGVLRGHPGVRIGRGVKLTGPGSYRLHRGSEISHGARIWVGPGATLTLGHGAKIGIRNIVNVQSGLTIGRTVRFSWDVQVLDTDFHWIRSASGRLQQMSRPIVIEDNVLVGTGSMILKGVTIGRGSVVGAGSVVRKSIEPGDVVIGNPAEAVGRVAEWGFGTPPAE